ncbi:hypothetical protein M378DRAFT_133842 [Amanita muscaria Koide BX008]|uniref:Uncharacterized protein n=1 Tax=Amanita muscaria (strain Koide BX008) TaxID=946122 RepID=A0A0C2SR24_AMAMK|nr:hypothetical protein M378DRAFT_133842 [Amanita muscaria Koide BX008]
MTTPPLDLENIQGDILGGLPKKTQTNVFFQIVNVPEFRKQLQHLIPLITTTEQVLKHRKDIDEHKRYGHPGLLKIFGVNIAFSHFGFKKLGIDDTKLADTGPNPTDPTNPFKNDPFLGGQLHDSQNLNDPGTGTGDNFQPDWLPEFKNELHGVFIFTGDRHDTVSEKILKVLHIFGVPGSSPSISVIITIRGDVRPGKEDGHEHFGFLDGISNPTVIGFDKNPPPGPASVRPGIVLVGRDGDPISSRDPWMVDGSFLAFRYLSQLVLEFNKFLKANPVKMPGLSDEEGSELLGARLVGRWKSGAPVDLRPFDDDPALAANARKNNNFFFTAEHATQKICPFAAHVRKTNPRADLNNNVEAHRILRRGIQFGPEVTLEERKEDKTIENRGLIFHSYQSSITNGFRFLQTAWANNPNFPPEVTADKPGFDAIIGQPPPGQVRTLSGTDPDAPSTLLTLPVLWVVPRGGEYFFSPSIKGLKETIALP